MNLSRREAIQDGTVFCRYTFRAGFLEPRSLSPAAGSRQCLAARSRDAEIAWRYFSTNLAGVDRGLVPAATWPEGDGYGRYDILTMWDTGSLILAYVSARSIGLIDEKEFDQRIKAVMAFLRRSEFRWGKLTLPNFRTANTGGRTIEPGYDATDTGRVLVALHVLDQARTAPMASSSRSRAGTSPTPSSTVGFKTSSPARVPRASASTTSTTSPAPTSCGASRR